jgi:hypothetical protein
MRRSCAAGDAVDGWMMIDCSAQSEIGNRKSEIKTGPYPGINPRKIRSSQPPFPSGLALLERLEKWTFAST